MNLVFGHDKAVADWASKKSGAPMREWFHAVGIIDNEGVLRGAATLHDMNGSNAELCFWGQNATSLGVVRGLARFVFVDLDVKRLSARTPRKNKLVARHLPRLGFKYEGILRHYYGPSKRLDAIMFGLLAEDAKRLIGGDA